MKVSENFYLQEFVGPHVYQTFGPNSLWLVDTRIIQLAQAVRNYFHRPTIINDWHFGGSSYFPGKVYQYSGYRSPNLRIGATYSQHKFGRAIDVKIRDIAPEEIRTAIRRNFKLFNQYHLTTIEKDTPTWVHLDIRQTNQNKLLEVPYN